MFAHVQRREGGYDGAARQEEKGTSSESVDGGRQMICWGDIDNERRTGL